MPFFRFDIVPSPRSPTLPLCSDAESKQKIRELLETERSMRDMAMDAPVAVVKKPKKARRKVTVKVAKKDKSEKKSGKVAMAVE